MSMATTQKLPMFSLQPRMILVDTIFTAETGAILRAVQSEEIDG